MAARRHLRRRGEEGSALVMTMMVLALLTALTTTVSVLTIENLRASWRAQQAGAALNAADAGVAQAVSYLRRSGVRPLACSPDCGTANRWGEDSAPMGGTLPGSGGYSYKAWIKPIRPYPANDPGLYRIYSTGYAGAGAERAVSVEVGVTTIDVPKGVFARTIQGGGDAAVSRESVFSTGCVYNRSKIEMVPGQLDLAYGIPIGVHSSQFITDASGANRSCDGVAKRIHVTGNPEAQQVCNTAYPFDQDREGGPFADGDTCRQQLLAASTSGYDTYYRARDLDGDGTMDVNGSYLKDDAALLKLFNLKSPALTQAQIDQLRAVAESQGNYWTSSSFGGTTGSGWRTPDEDNAVMFFDLSLASAHDSRMVDLNDIDNFGREPNQPNDSTCQNKSLVIVVDGGNVKLNSNRKLAASLLLTSTAPYGQVFKANGTSTFIGTIYADVINLTGTIDVSLDECFLANTSPALLDLRIGAYRELDRDLS